MSAKSLISLFAAAALSLAAVQSIQAATKSVSEIRTRRVALIPAEMPGSPFSTTEEYWISVLASAERYFADQFGADSSVVFDLASVVQLSSACSEASLSAGIVEACRLASIELDFRLYDCDEDKAVDDVFVLFSGSAIRPQFGKLISPISIHGKTISYYSTASEFSGADTTRVGTICHEYAHSLGLPDLYDADGEGSRGRSEALWGKLSLMDEGDHNDSCRTPAGFCSIDHEILGLGQADTLKPGHFNLQPLGRSRRHLVFPTHRKGESFLFECREAQGWDSGIGGSGLLIYHIDRSSQNAGYSTHFARDLSAAERWELSPAQINCNPFHQCADLVEASTDASSIGEVFWRSGSFSSDTSPAFRCWDGTQTGLAIRGITTEADGSVSFDVIRPLELTTMITLQTAIVLRWVVDSALLGEGFTSKVSWSLDGEQIGSEECKPDPRGRCEVVITDLKASPNYLNRTTYNIRIEQISEDATYSLDTEATTAIMDPGASFPFIFIDREAMKDGAFKKGSRLPLVVCNAPQHESIRWSWDGHELSTIEDGFFTIPSSGTLRAEILRTDGSVDVIVKSISAR